MPSNAASIAVDTSVAIPLLVATHRAHRDVVRWWADRELALAGHALAETYSVLTRLPGDIRLTPMDAAQLIAARFARPVLLESDTAARLPRILAEAGIAGGAVYDAMVALAALTNDSALATRDARAKLTYDAIGVHVEVVA
jgi:predicted nucleic acid-binding protein